MQSPYRKFQRKNFKEVEKKLGGQESCLTNTEINIITSKNHRNRISSEQVNVESLQDKLDDFVDKPICDDFHESENTDNNIQSLYDQFDRSKYAKTDQSFIPFSEFMKEKQRSGVNMPNVKNSSRNNLSPEKVYRPHQNKKQLSKFKTDGKIRFVKKGSLFTDHQSHNSEVSVSKASVNDKYFEGLKHKFQPLVESKSKTRQIPTCGSPSSGSGGTISRNLKRKASKKTINSNYYHKTKSNQYDLNSAIKTKSRADSK